MIEEYTAYQRSTKKATMSHSSNRQRADIWKRPPRDVVAAASAASTPPIRPSNSFAEKVFRDCLKPRNYTLGADKDRKHTGTIAQSDKGTNTDSQQQQQQPTIDYSYITPPRRSRDSRHDPPGEFRFADGARTVPPRSTYSRDVGILGARSAPPRHAQLQPRNYGLVSDPFRTVPPQSTYLQPRNFGRVLGNVRTALPIRKRDQPRDYDPVINDSRTKSPHRTNQSMPRDYGPITDHTKTNYPRRPKNYQPKLSNYAKPKTPSGRDNPQQRRDPYSSSTQPSSFSSPFSSFQEEREQALRDYKVTIEYKHLKSHAPGGVYLIPSMESLRNFHGIIFVRRGPFTNGIFKFRLDLPAKYNDTNMWPKITFSSKVYNPYVNEKTGELDVQTAYPSWDPSRHYLVTVLTFLKKIFYSKNFADAKANPAARELAEKDPQAYKKKVEACVHESQKKVYVNEKGSTAKFTEEEVAHRVLRDLLKHHIRNENQVTKQTILAQVEKSRKV